MKDVALVVLVLVPLGDWITSVMLWRASRRYPDISALRERRNIAIAIATAVTIVAILAINSRIAHIAIPPDLGTLVLLTALVLPSAFNWWWAIQAWVEGGE